MTVYHKHNLLFKYDNMSKYFRVHIVRVTESSESQLLSVNIDIDIDMTSETAGDVIKKCQE